MQVHKALLAAEEVNAGHAVQVVDTIDVSAVEYVLLPQAMQAAEPGADFHLPAPQGVHATPLSPVYPARQVHDVSRGLLAAEAVLAGQSVQFAAAANE
jgi:hypothetical protein